MAERGLVGTEPGLSLEKFGHKPGSFLLLGTRFVSLFPLLGGIFPAGSAPSTASWACLWLLNVWTGTGLWGSGFQLCCPTPEPGSVLFPSLCSPGSLGWDGSRAGASLGWGLEQGWPGFVVGVTRGQSSVLQMWLRRSHSCA